MVYTVENAWVNKDGKSFVLAVASNKEYAQLACDALNAYNKFGSPEYKATIEQTLRCLCDQAQETPIVRGRLEKLLQRC